MTCVKSQRALLLAISLVSIASGVYVSYKAIHETPKPDFDRIGSESVAQLRGFLQLPDLTHSKPGTMLYDAEHLLLLLVAIFYELCSPLFGSAVRIG